MEDREVRRILARNLRAYARARGLTFNRVADFAAVSRSQIFAVLARKTSPTVTWLVRVSKVLKCEPWELLAPQSSSRR